MALTFTQLTPAAAFWQAGPFKFWMGFIQLDTSYPTGGYSIPDSQAGVFGMLDVIGVQIIGVNAAGSLICRVVWDYTNSKLVAYGPGAGSGTIVSTFTGSALGNHAHSLLLKDAAVVDGATTRVNAGANLLGANTGGDLTVAGAGANGGVQNASAGTPAGSIVSTFTGTGGASFAQIANAVNLSAVTVKVQMVGR